MNKKNTKKFRKRILNNYITILPCKLTYISFDNRELPMFTHEKPLNLGQNIVVKQLMRGKITGKVKSLKRFKYRKCRGWKMLVAVKNVAYFTCLKFGE
ncbi:MULTISPECIES: hypothetical protein [Fusobacterium]|jgi:hypothetical protein|uniref:hypothetical protein n=1 Tax=Fusobacterium TaxID=848 RepID=UPI000449E73F|nr:hypothetical protein [Fusobacterium sp. CM22]EUB28295.1 hypothetical protein HMPREF1500_2318 [Fusobacterium sp. CM22]DAJ58052.1 MAG TPA: hypothetical protein [Caudoviricetes sp.]